MSVEDTVAASSPGAGLVGAQLGAYRIEQLLGEGAMGEVFLATHVALGRPVAIKTLKPHVASDRSLTERFFAEARAVNIIRHENIVECTDLVNDPGGRSYIVMELLEGKTLGAAMRDAGPMPPKRAARIAAQIADAIGAAHDKGIVHRDLKPENVYLIKRAGSPDYVKVLDFGIARLRPELGGVAATQTGALIGTPAYMSPEQVRGEKAGPAADIYALGTIAFHMLTGRLPFQETSLSMMLVAQLQETPPRADAIAPEVPRAMADAIASALAKDPAERPASMAAFRHALLAAAGVPVDPQGSLAEPSVPRPAVVTPATTSGLEPTLAPAAVEARPAVGMSSISGAASELARSAPTPRPWRYVAGGGVAAIAIAAIAIIVTRADDEPARSAKPSSELVEVAAVPRSIEVKTPTGMTAPAAKEWEAIVQALQAGRTVRARQRISAWQQRHGETPESRDVLAQLDRLHGGAVADEAGPPTAPGSGDHFDAALHELQAGKTCEDRKAAVATLRALGDARAISHLERARKRSGVLGVASNACLVDVVDDAIAHLSARSGPAAAFEVELHSEPTGATVYDHDHQREVCRTPCTQTVTAVTRYMVGLDGYAKGFVMVDPASGKRQYIVTLAAMPGSQVALGTVQVESSPPARIWYRGKLVGVTPLRLSFPPGTYTFEAEGPTGDKQRFVVDVTAGEVAREVLTMKPRPK